MTMIYFISDIVYLDHTGSTLYAKSQIQRYQEDLLKNTYGNPHSGCLSSELSSEVIDNIRKEILSFFNTSSEKYHVVFTSNATNGLQLIAENFTFGTEAHHHFSHQEANSSVRSTKWFVYLQDNHTSVVGIRTNALSKGVKIRPVTYEESSKEKLNIDPANPAQFSESNHFIDAEKSGSFSAQFNHDDKNHEINNLFAFPAMSNFSGHKYPLEWINFVQDSGPFSKKEFGKWFVLLDAASFVSTSPLDLGSYQPDFVPISFYKLFGFPTGLGALIVSVRGSYALKKSYFGGGTVSAYSSNSDFHILKSFQDRCV